MRLRRLTGLSFTDNFFRLYRALFGATQETFGALKAQTESSRGYYRL
jgi:hypothetical protein